jgi:hypothetical protein
MKFHLMNKVINCRHDGPDILFAGITILRQKLKLYLRLCLINNVIDQLIHRIVDVDRLAFDFKNLMGDCDISGIVLRRTCPVPGIGRLRIYFEGE